MALDQRSLSRFPGAYTLCNPSLLSLRKNLFALIGFDEKIFSQPAEASPMLIDEIRDEHGRVNSAPRHPDVETGRPWPLLKE
jgi:hypothetical protein